MSIVSGGLRRVWEKISEAMHCHDAGYGRIAMTILEILFKIESRGSTISTEIVGGVIHFLSVCSVLAVNSAQLSEAGYDKSSVATATAVSCACTCILTGLIGNMPFVSTPTLATSIYLSVFMKINRISLAAANVGVMLTGFLLLACVKKELLVAMNWFIPKSIEIGILVGLSLLVSLQTLSHLGFVVPGSYTLLELGHVWTHNMFIVLMTFVLIALLLHYRIKGAYVVGLLLGSVVSWSADKQWPHKLCAPLSLSFAIDSTALRHLHVWVCACELFVISVVVLSGLSSSLAALARIQRQTTGSPPRLRWLYFACGVGTLISAGLGAGPVLLSAESAIAIQYGARTGLSSCVCGLLFLGAAFFFPLWASVPTAGTSAVLLMVAVMLFENVQRVQWEVTSERVVVFVSAVFAAFTCSVLCGLLSGLTVHVIMYICTDMAAMTGQLVRLRAYQQIGNVVDDTSDFFDSPVSSSSSIIEESKKDDATT